jgi:molecular chaperone DnaJ
VTIPAGVDDGSVLRLRGEGEAGTRGGPAGDLLLVIRVQDDPLFVRKGKDIWIDAKVPFTTAALGGEVKVPSLHGEATLKVPPGTQSGQALRLRKLGIGPEGDQIVKVLITVPKDLDEKQRELLEKLRGLD